MGIVVFWKQSSTWELCSCQLFCFLCACRVVIYIMGICSAVFRCEYAPCSGVSPSKHQTQSQDKRRRWSTQKLQANKQYQPVWMFGTNINQFECLAPVSSSMMARWTTTCTCTIIHGQNFLNHYNNYQWQVILVSSALWSFGRVAVPMLSLVPIAHSLHVVPPDAKSARNQGCFTEKLGWLRCERVDEIATEKNVLKYVSYFQVSSDLWDWIIEILPSPHNSLYKTMCLLYFGPPNHGDTCF